MAQWSGLKTFFLFGLRHTSLVNICEASPLSIEKSTSTLPWRNTFRSLAFSCASFPSYISFGYGWAASLCLRCMWHTVKMPFSHFNLYFICLVFFILDWLSVLKIQNSFAYCKEVFQVGLFRLKVRMGTPMDRFVWGQTPGKYWYMC